MKIATGPGLRLVLWQLRLMGILNCFIYDLKISLLLPPTWGVSAILTNASLCVHCLEMNISIQGSRGWAARVHTAVWTQHTDKDPGFESVMIRIAFIIPFSSQSQQLTVWANRAQITKRSWLSLPPCPDYSGAQIRPKQMYYHVDDFTEKKKDWGWKWNCGLLYILSMVDGI